MIKHYVEFCYPGIIVSETSSKECDNRNHLQIEFPEGSDGFRFFDREVKEGKTGELVGKRHNISGWYYRGIVKTQADIVYEQPDSILAKNMVNNKIEKVLMSIHGQALGLNEDDTVLRSD